MANLNDVKIDSLFTMLKGEPGTRKSTQALSYPTPQFWVSTDKKMGALTLPAQKWGIDKGKIEYEDYRYWNIEQNQVVKKLESLRLNCPYKTIIVDSVTSIADTINLQILGQKSGQTNKQGEEKGARIGGIAINTLDDYKAEASAFTELISLLKQIKEYNKVHIILIAHVIGERDAKQTADITSAARVIITGGKKISGSLSAYCEEVYHFNARGSTIPGQVDFSCFTRHTGGDYARTMLPLDTEIKFGDEPLYEKWIRPAIDKLNSGEK